MLTPSCFVTELAVIFLEHYLCPQMLLIHTRTPILIIQFTGFPASAAPRSQASMMSRLPRRTSIALTVERHEPRSPARIIRLPESSRPGSLIMYAAIRAGTRKKSACSHLRKSLRVNSRSTVIIRLDIGLLIPAVHQTFARGVTWSAEFPRSRATRASRLSLSNGRRRQHHHPAQVRRYAQQCRSPHCRHVHARQVAHSPTTRAQV